MPRTVGSRLLAAAILLAAIVSAAALGMPYIKGEVRKDIEPLIDKSCADCKEDANEKIADLKTDLRDIKRSLDRLLERPR